MKTLCFMIGHSGDWQRASVRRDGWHSFCKRCDAPLVKDLSGGRWRPEHADDASAAA